MNSQDTPMRIDDPDEPEIALPRKRIPFDEPSRKKRLYRLIVADCTVAQIAADLNLTRPQVYRLIELNGYLPAYRENQRRRQEKRKPKPYSKHMKLTQAVLEDFESRGYAVRWGRTLKDSTIEGFPVIVFAPKSLSIRVVGTGIRRYWHIKSRFLDRFAVVVLPNGKRVFRWPRPKIRTDLYIPEQEAETPEEWPSKAEFREQKKILSTEKELETMIEERRAHLDDLDEKDLYRMLGILDENDD